MAWDVPSGGCSQNPALFGDDPTFTGWVIRSPSNVILGSSSGSSGGWFVNVGGLPGVYQVTVCSPVAQATGTNYSLQMFSSGNFMTSTW